METKYLTKDTRFIDKIETLHFSKMNIIMKNLEELLYFIRILFLIINSWYSISFIWYVKEKDQRLQ